MSPEAVWTEAADATALTLTSPLALLTLSIPSTCSTLVFPEADSASKSP